ncbi:hypothetical protein [Cytobacillus firmus]|uniref:hypothetical protein n=1 Tax=Cytobacillus firmus TaxID=1399 RepID=UPI0018CF8133|nr:hypothetical protein [Cytobacillus firmus]MBG9589400.1 hypothetical protein [Cytobacillus firmus]
MLVFILHFPLNKWLFSQGFLLFCILFTELIGAEGARSSKMQFLRAVFLEGAYSPPAPLFAEQPGAEINKQH